MIRVTWFYLHRSWRNRARIAFKKIKHPRYGLGLLFGLGYADQVVPRVPHDSRDRRMDAIVTERGIRRVTGTEA